MLMYTKRLPRPLSSTEIGRSGDIERLRSFLLNHYIVSNFRFCGDPIEIDHFALFMKVSKSFLTKRYLKRTAKLAKMLGDPSQMAQALMVKTFEWAAEDRSSIIHQLSLLQKAQGGTYKPFISNELGSTLGLLNPNTRLLLDIAKTLAPSSQSQITINNNNKQTDNYLTITKAVELLSDGEKDPKQLPIAQELSSLPEVRATHQAKVKSDGVSPSTDFDL